MMCCSHIRSLLLLRTFTSKYAWVACHSTVALCEMTPNTAAGERRRLASWDISAGDFSCKTAKAGVVYGVMMCECRGKQGGLVVIEYHL